MLTSRGLKRKPDNQQWPIRKGYKGGGGVLHELFWPNELGMSENVTGGKDGVKTNLRLSINEWTLKYWVFYTTVHAQIKEPALR